jgi:hypothetical protein
MSRVQGNGREELHMANIKKPTDTATRRVWRMTASAPLGEYVEVATSSASAADVQGNTPRRRATDEGARSPPISEPDTGLRRRADDVGAVSPFPSKVLKPAQAENWQSSSFDLFSGCQTRDVTDTIPDNVFDELFGKSDMQPPDKKSG